MQRPILLFIILAIALAVYGCARTMKHSRSKTGEIEVHLPKEELVATRLSLEGKPHVGVFNSGIMQLEPKEAFSWYLSLIIDYAKTVGEEMPLNDDTVKMQDFSDLLSEKLAIDSIHPNALFLGRVTGEGQTQIMWYVNNPELAHEYLQGLIDSGDYPFEFEYQMTHDKDWKEAHFWLDPLK